MPFCSKCGFNVSNDDNFCARCGAKSKYNPAKELGFDTDNTSQFVQDNANMNNTNQNQNLEQERKQEPKQEQEANNIINPKLKKKVIENPSDNNDDFDSPEKDTSDKHFIDWKIHLKKEKTSIFSKVVSSIKHSFVDEEELSATRRMMNAFLILLIIVAAIWILSPFLESIKFGVTNQAIGIDGNCKYRLEDNNIIITNAKFHSSDSSMTMMITNTRKTDLVLETIAKTYEFNFDNKGNTKLEHVGEVLPAGETISQTFNLDQEPYILGLEFSGCKKKKVENWEVVTE